MQATRKQKAIIHIAKQQLGLDDDTYRAVLRAVTGKESAARLTLREAERVIDHFVSQGFRVRPQGEDRRQRFRDLADRPGMASAEQLRMIEAIWSELGFRPGGLRRFVFRVAKVSDLRFLTSGDATAVIRAIMAIRARRLG